MVRFLIAALLALLLGCDPMFPVPPDPDPRDDIANWVCTDKEMEKAQREAVFCDKSTDFFASYCYRSAIQRNCTYSPVWARAKARP